MLNRYLHPHLGHVAVGEVTSAMIDATYAELRRCGGRRGQPLPAGMLARVHVVLRATFAQAMRRHRDASGDEHERRRVGRR